MKVGLLWYDDNPGRDLAEKIGRAARRYRQKFGTSPNICYVHRSVQASQGEVGNGNVRKLGGVRISPSPTVLRHHFWLGREEEQHRQRAAK
ncbi:MAG: hypothetical protein SWK90_02835 [Chloroflexota bacterium]|nr:hypothetical protein [Chloroflexota bacterium]